MDDFCKAGRSLAPKSPMVKDVKQPTEFLALAPRRGGAANSDNTYLGVTRNDTRSGLPWRGTVWNDGKRIHLGVFATEWEAAVAVEAQPSTLRKAAKLAEGAVAMPDDVAQAAAVALGVELKQKGDGQSWDDYKGSVLRKKAGLTKPWEAYAGHGKHQKRLGLYARSAEAALHAAYYQRFGVELRHAYTYTSGGALPCPPLATPQKVASSPRVHLGGGVRLGGGAPPAATGDGTRKRLRHIEESDEHEEANDEEAAGEADEEAKEEETDEAVLDKEFQEGKMASWAWSYSMGELTGVFPDRNAEELASVLKQKGNLEAAVEQLLE